MLPNAFEKYRAVQQKEITFLHISEDMDDEDKKSLVISLDEFCGRNWTRADAIDMEVFDEEQIVVYNTMLKQWLKVPIGWNIIRGLHGEFWPMDDETFDELYEIL